jgi:hypothetical protein
VFARFLAKFNHTSVEIPPDVYADVIQLFGVALPVYKDEIFRDAAIKALLVKLMGDTYASQSQPGATPDSVVTTSLPDRPTAYRGFLEVKNEVGTGGCEPCTQGFIAYEKFWSHQEVRLIDRLSSIGLRMIRIGRASLLIMLLSELHNRHRRSIYSRSRCGFCRSSLGRHIDEGHLSRAGQD